MILVFLVFTEAADSISLTISKLFLFLLFCVTPKSEILSNNITSHAAKHGITELETKILNNQRTGGRYAMR
jgi:hypothetical protein